MTIEEYVLVVALYADAEEAVADLRDLTAPGVLNPAVAGSGILHRDWRRSMLHQGGGGTLAYGIGTGAAAGIVIGVFVGLPLLGGAAGALVGGVVGRRVSRREVDGLLALLDDAIPHNRDAVAHAHRLDLVMCHVDGRQVQVREDGAQLLRKALAQGAVQ